MRVSHQANIRQFINHRSSSTITSRALLSALCIPKLEILLVLMLLLLFMFVWFKAWDVEFIIISGYHEHDMLCNRIINDFGPLLTLYMQSTRTKLKLLLFYLRARVLLVTNQYSHCLRVYCASRSYFVKVTILVPSPYYKYKLRSSPLFAEEKKLARRNNNRSKFIGSKKGL